MSKGTYAAVWNGKVHGHYVHVHVEGEGEGEGWVYRKLPAATPWIVLNEESNDV